METSLDATMTRSGPGRHVLYCFDTKCDLKWVLVRIAAFCCAHRPQIWIPETEYCQKVSSHAQIRPQGAEKLLRKVKLAVYGKMAAGKQA